VHLCGIGVDSLVRYRLGWDRIRLRSLLAYRRSTWRLGIHRGVGPSCRLPDRVSSASFALLEVDCLAEPGEVLIAEAVGLGAQLYPMRLVGCGHRRWVDRRPVLPNRVSDSLSARPDRAAAADRCIWSGRVPTGRLACWFGAWVLSSREPHGASVTVFACAALVHRGFESCFHVDITHALHKVLPNESLLGEEVVELPREEAVGTRLVGELAPCLRIEHREQEGGSSGTAGIGHL
jgi:hypothetical protein